MKIAYIDHWFRSVSKSTTFLEQALGSIGATTLVASDCLNEEFYSRLVDSSYDWYVVTQNDPLVVFLLSNGKRVVCIPMYDGSGGLPIINWLAQRGGVFLNFCQYIHAQTIRAGCESSFIQYYPPCFGGTENTRRSTPNNRNLNLFFWERVPSSGMSVRWLCDLVKRWNIPIDKVHVHLAPDPGEISSLEDVEVLRQEMLNRSPKACVTTSKWFADKEQMINKMQESDIYVCPRPAEGIGLGFLEAFAAGCCVLALNRPTMNEYIQNNANGLLIDNLTDTPTCDDVMSIKQMGAQALRRHNQLSSDIMPQLVLLLRNILTSQTATTINLRTIISSKEAVRLSQAFMTSHTLYCSLLYKHCIVTRATNSPVTKVDFIRQIASSCHHRLKVSIENLYHVAPVLSSQLDNLVSRLTSAAYTQLASDK